METLFQDEMVWCSQKDHKHSETLPAGGHSVLAGLLPIQKQFDQGPSIQYPVCQSRFNISVVFQSTEVINCFCIRWAEKAQGIPWLPPASFIKSSLISVFRPFNRKIAAYKTRLSGPWDNRRRKPTHLAEWARLYSGDMIPSIYGVRLQPNTHARWMLGYVQSRIFAAHKYFCCPSTCLCSRQTEFTGKVFENKRTHAWWNENPTMYDYCET